jgi:hypothetical protein
LSSCPHKPELIATFVFFSPEDKNKEKDKGGDNSTDTTQGILYVRIEDQSSHLNLLIIVPFPTANPVSYCFPCHQGAEPPRNTARQSLFGAGRLNVVWLASGYCFLSTECRGFVLLAFYIAETRWQQSDTQEVKIWAFVKLTHIHPGLLACH